MARAAGRRALGETLGARPDPPARSLPRSLPGSLPPAGRAHTQTHSHTHRHTHTPPRGRAGCGGALLLPRALPKRRAAPPRTRTRQRRAGRAAPAPGGEQRPRCSGRASPRGGAGLGPGTARPRRPPDPADLPPRPGHAVASHLYRRPAESWSPGSAVGARRCAAKEGEGAAVRRARPSAPRVRPPRSGAALPGCGRLLWHNGICGVTAPAFHTGSGRIARHAPRKENANSRSSPRGSRYRPHRRLFPSLPLHNAAQAGPGPTAYVTSTEGNHVIAAKNLYSQPVCLWTF
ncbi:translation initiation factor IF-2-like [Coturnix japonica]|uniref:translation initiation factor IF-2-like n=1 Tax=Coturnix japonica TaxID=93934 RepID=UPI0013A5DE06|nr:translation initiation factor IF-2-like [Coturnix japonica]XP_032302886.1 translation initiation factor IF-2-like [Coturnix japonica]